MKLSFESLFSGQGTVCREVASDVDDNPSIICDQLEVRKQLMDILLRLSHRERTVIAAIFWDEKPLRRIAKELNVTIQRVHQIKRGGLERLRVRLKQMT